MTSILGISGLYHDSAACLVIDGQVVAAAHEERFSRRKHDASFPVNAVRWCLQIAGVDPADVDYVAFYEKPFLKFDRLLHSFVDTAPTGLPAFLRAIPSWLNQKLHVRRLIERALQAGLKRRPVFVQHHMSHAASAFFTSPFKSSAILTVDGVGEWATTTVSAGTGHLIRPLAEMQFPDSLGLFYSAFTAFCGFQVNEGEYKLMGLAPLGEPIYQDAILSELIDLRDDGSFAMNLEYFAFRSGSKMTSPRVSSLFDGPPRRSEAAVTQREMDIAASVQKVTEEVLLRMVRHVHETTGEENLCLAGGVALNCVANGRLQREGPFREIWIPPAPGDAGGAVGAALFVWHQLLEEPRAPASRLGVCDRNAYLGPAYSDDEITDALRRSGLAWEECADRESLCTTAAELIAKGAVIGWFQGRSEFGPRALGARSILADPRSESMQDRINQLVKRRESFRPFAPVVTSEAADHWFDLPVKPSGICSSATRLMLLTGNAKTDALPAVTHTDGSSRVQILDRDDNPLLHELICRFGRLTDVPVLLNTSFNVKGQPIVESPDDACSCFLESSLDALVIGQKLVVSPGFQKVTGEA